MFLEQKRQDGSATAPHDDGDGDFDGDYPVKAPERWEFDHDLTPHDVDNDGKIELPLVAQVSDILPTNEYDKPHVVMHTVTHEMGHSVGITYPIRGGHCADPTCAMYYLVPNYNRHGHFCNDCRSRIYIHND